MSTEGLSKGVCGRCAGAALAVARVAVGLLLLAQCLLPCAAIGQPRAAAADEVKAAYLYKFVDYIEWPPAAFPGPDTPLVIGVVEAEGVYAELERVLVGRSAHGRPLAARRVVPGDAIDGVQVLFIGDPALSRGAWLQRLRDRPVLIVTDGPGGLEAGGALNFVLVSDHLRFEASLRSVERAGLKASSRLLALAQRVVPSP